MEGTEHVNADDGGAKDEDEGERIVEGANVVENASNYGAADNEDTGQKDRCLPVTPVFDTGTGLGLKQ